MLGAAVAQGNDVVALHFEIVEAGGVSVPTGRIALFGANNVRCGAHFNASESKRTVNESDFEINRGSRLQFARREKKHAARTDIACDERDRNRLRNAFDVREAQRQAEISSRITTPLVSYANSMRRNREAARPSFQAVGTDWLCEKFEFMCRRGSRQWSNSLRNSTHETFPSVRFAADSPNGQMNMRGQERRVKPQSPEIELHHYH